MVVSLHGSQRPSICFFACRSVAVVCQMCPKKVSASPLALSIRPCSGTNLSAPGKPIITWCQSVVPLIICIGFCNIPALPRSAKARSLDPRPGCKYTLDCNISGAKALFQSSIWRPPCSAEDCSTNGEIMSDLLHFLKSHCNISLTC